MDLGIQQVSKRRRIRSAQSTTEYVLDISQTSENENVISLSKWETEDGGRVRLSGPICQWEKARGEIFGTHAVLDSRNSLIFASLKDRRRYVTLQIPKDMKNGQITGNARELELKSPLFALAVVPEVAASSNDDLVVAVSETGELSVLWATGHSSEVEKRVLDPLPVDSVLAVSSGGEKCLVVTGLQNSDVVMFPMQFEADGRFSSMSLERMSAIQLPKPPLSVLSSKKEEESFILDFIFDERYVAVLYAGGLVHILRPETGNQMLRNRNTKSGNWHESGERDVVGDAIVISKIHHAFWLSSCTVEDTPVSMSKAQNGNHREAGGMTKLDVNYFAIGYGQYVSIWDWAYHIGHGVVRIDDHLSTVCPGHSLGKALIGSKSGLEELSVGDIASCTPFSLGFAIARKGTCDFIVTSVPQASEAVPMRSQPITVAVTKIAAEAEGDSHRVFRPKLEALDREEVKLVRQLLNRSETSSPEAVSRLTKGYTTEHKKVRRGNRGKYSDLGLAMLPSERLAAVSVSRCLYEIHFENPKFLVPLIDMVGTGVVSSEAVLAVMGTSDSWSMGADSEPLALLSIVDPLMTSDIFMNALEAIVTRVADLPEPDIVRVLQFVVRLTQDEFSSAVKMEGVSGSGDNRGQSERLARATHLLLSCVTSQVDKKRVVESLRQIPIADVNAILDRFDHIISATTTGEVRKRAQIPRASLAMRDGFFFKPSAFFDQDEIAKYRGVGDWMDHDENRNVLGRKSVISGCIEWTSHLIDAHLTNLIMDETGQELAARLLQTVRERRGEFEVIKSLHGLTSHLMDGKPFPSQSDPLYTNSFLDVPAYASLQ